MGRLRRRATRSGRSRALAGRALAHAPRAAADRGCSAPPGARPEPARRRGLTETTMEAIKDASALYEVERRAEHAARLGFRITELQISKKQKVPWHYHSNVQDTFYVLQGSLRIFLREPKEEVRLAT